jgi:hypothetical protein
LVAVHLAGLALEPGNLTGIGRWKFRRIPAAGEARAPWFPIVGRREELRKTATSHSLLGLGMRLDDGMRIDVTLHCGDAAGRFASYLPNSRLEVLTD